MPAEEILHKYLGESFTVSEFRGDRRAVVPPDKVYAALSALRGAGHFDMLVDLSAVDYLHYPDATDRYGLVYIVANTETGERLIIRTFVNDPDPTVPSVVPIWRGADWMEREVFDLFGITFTGHPDLRRILMPDGFEGHPLRKDYPLRGYGERHNHQVLTRAEG